jgi:serine/threonine protein kinase
MGTVRVRCPNEACSARDEVHEGWLGRTAKCKRCGTAFVVCRDVWSKGEVILREFQIEGKLGQGGMGAVYLVRSRHSGQRFAVKRTLQRDPAGRRNFLAELRTWIDLPPHPHLVACRFFRTIEDEIAIFSEFVDGGSLARWIERGRLTQVEQMLDVAIQFAWGLHAAHEMGLIHQDVKPANVLLTKKGLAKVSDFGLARARAQGVMATGQEGQSLAVTGAGLMTPAYCSPEQAYRQRLTRKTDIWSWGVSVLEMFNGEPFRAIGPAAPEFLRTYLANGPARPGLPPMPAAVVEVLQRCLVKEPAQRLPNLAEAAEVLQRTYEQVVGRQYPRDCPADSAGREAPLTHDRRTTTGLEWRDPRDWLIQAFQAAGKDPAEVKQSESQRPRSRKAEALVDLVAYEEARLMFEQLVKAGRKQFEPRLASLCLDNALVHESTEDIPGAIDLYDRAIAIYTRLVEQEGRADLAHHLARACGNKANSVRALGDNRAAVDLYDMVIAIYKRLVEQEGRAALANNLALAYMNKASAVSALGDKRAAVDLYDRAIAIHKQLVEQEGRAELADDLAAAYMNKAGAVTDLGDNRAAVDLYDRAIAIRKRLVEQQGRAELADGLALAYMNKATAVSALDDNRAAVDLCDQVIAIRKHLVEHEGRAELANDLATAYLNKAVAVSALGDKRAAVDLYDRVIAIRKRLVEQEGRAELANDLALAYMNKASTVSALGDKRAAVELGDRAIAIWKRLVEQEGRAELANDLASAYMNKANAVDGLGDNRAAVDLYDEAIAIFKRLVEQEERAELANGLAMAYMNKAFGLSALGDTREAVYLCDRAMTVYKRLIEQEGRAELLGDLALALAFQAKSFLDLGDHRTARTNADKAMALLKSEVGRTGRADLQAVLEWAMKTF